MAAKRDKNGRFIKGTVPNPKGRPPKVVEESYKQLLMAAVTPEAWKSIIGMAVSQAIQGDAKARDFIAERILGKPNQPISGELNVDLSRMTDDQLERIATNL